MYSRFFDLYESAANELRTFLDPAIERVRTATLEQLRRSQQIVSLVMLRRSLRCPSLEDTLRFVTVWSPDILSRIFIAMTPSSE